MLKRLAISPALIGIVLSLLSLPLHALITHAQSVQLAATIIAVIGAIYGGFALQLGSLKQMIIELAVATLFIAVAMIGMWANPWVIPVAYVAHGIWDMAHHKNHGPLVDVPIWYPPFCAAYDFVFAIGLATIWWRWI